jgi:hypothetical protein
MSATNNSHWAAKVSYQARANILPVLRHRLAIKFSACASVSSCRWRRASTLPGNSSALPGVR